MPDNEKDDFYGVSEEEIEAVRKQRIACEQEADLLLKSAQICGESERNVLTGCAKDAKHSHLLHNGLPH